MAPLHSARALGWGFSLVGGLTIAAGGLMVWQARLHNAIVSSAVDNPWPGYVTVALGAAAMAAGVAFIRRSKQRL